MIRHQRLQIFMAEHMLTRPNLSLQNLLIPIQTHIPATAFVGGFCFDLATLGRIDSYTNFFVHGFWLLISGMILVMTLVAQSEWTYTGPRIKRRLASSFLKHDQFVFHFALGALLSAFTIFYFKSSSAAVSILFLGLLAGLLILNEMKRFQKIGPFIRCMLYQIALLTFATYIIPILLGSLSYAVFALALCSSAAIALGLGAVLKKLDYPARSLRLYYLNPTLIAFGLFTGLYASNAIPPIPLSTQHIGVYHDVRVSKSGYAIKRDPRGQSMLPFAQDTFFARPADKVFVFTRIFAPRHFSDSIYLRWQKELANGSWHTTDTIPMKIRGGREMGYRGYGYKADYQAGNWRVFVETKDGREVGSVSFAIQKDDSDTSRIFQSRVH
ncbi:MAG: DUF2914 domain-containing protein [Deltaproteobacteria bacterium]|nr:DUF2914 domain-containing protein [Deltaproteobacteria bacterium]